MPRQLSVCRHAAPTSAVEHNCPQPLRPRLLDHVLDVHIVRAARRHAGEKGRTNREKERLGAHAEFVQACQAEYHCAGRR